MDNEALVQETLKIIDYFQKNNVIIRIMGAIAFRIHCNGSLELFKALERNLTDIDLVSYSKYTREVVKLMENLNYLADKHMRMMMQLLDRYTFKNEATGYHVDVFFDKLPMSHTIDFKNRLEIDYPTIPLAELLLEKMQIVQLTEKDIKDTIILLLTHDIGDNDKETINGKYVAKVLANDWGFYYTVTTNLNKVKEYAPNFKILNNEQLEKINTQTNSMLNIIENEPKSMGWKIRSKIGMKKKWYNEVESLS